MTDDPTYDENGNRNDNYTVCSQCGHPMSERELALCDRCAATLKAEAQYRMEAREQEEE